MLYQVDLKVIVLGILFLLTAYTIGIVLNIKIVKGRYGFLPGTIKLYSIAVIASVSCNFIDVIFIKNNITDNVSWIKLILLVVTFIKILSLKNSGDPSWIADYKDVYAGELDPEKPFSSTEGMSFCIMVAYTFPTIFAIIVTGGIVLIQGICNLQKYKLKRAFILCAMAGIETAIASWLVRLSYGFDILKALFFVALIGMIFNIVLGSLNEIILDYFTGESFFKD